MAEEDVDEDDCDPDWDGAYAKKVDFNDEHVWPSAKP